MTTGALMRVCAEGARGAQAEAEDAARQCYKPTAKCTGNAP